MDMDCLHLYRIGITFDPCHYRLISISDFQRLVLCRVIKTAQNYAILANNTCISVEAAYLHNILFYHTFTTTGNRLVYYITVAWGKEFLHASIFLSLSSIHIYIFNVHTS